MMNNKGQVWYTDFMVGILILVATILIYFQFIYNFSFESEGALDDLMRDAKIVSNSLMNSGYPPSWNSTNATRIGITDEENRLNTTRLWALKEMDYNLSRNIFSINSDYFIYFERDGEKQRIDGIDDLGINESNPDKLVSTTRMLFYDGSIYEMKILLWSKTG